MLSEAHSAVAPHVATLPPLPAAAHAPAPSSGAAAAKPAALGHRHVVLQVQAEPL